MAEYEALIQNLRSIDEYDTGYAKLIYDAADAIDKLVKICNSLLSKYEEEVEAVIWEYSWNIDEDIDELHKEIEDYKAQINGVAEPPKEET